MSRHCPRPGCRVPLARPEALICAGDFAALASMCRGKERQARTETRVLASRGFGRAYQCLLCAHWHNGLAPTQQRIMVITMRAVLRVLRADPRCGPAGLRQLAAAWAPPGVNRESWASGLDQSIAVVLP